MANLYWLEQIQPDHLASVGLKALHLSQVLQQGCPVLPGFVVAAEEWQAFLETVPWLDPLFADLPTSSLHLNIDDPQQLQAIARQLRNTVSSPPLPDALLQDLEVAIRQLPATTLILRPSLVVEPLPRSLMPPLWADVLVHTSGLIASQTSAANLPEFAQGLKRLWAEFFGAKNLFYWQRLGVPFQHVKLAVLVQPLQSAIASGTIQPVPYVDAAHIELHATIGLGMALERGEVVPDTYQIEPETGTVLTQQLGQRSIAYDVNPSVSPPGSAATVALRTYPLNDQQRADFVLTDDQVQTLRYLYQQITVVMGNAIAVEWTLLAAPHHSAQPFVTQVIPQSRSTVVPIPPNALPEPAKRGVELFAGAELIARGLAAAPGQAIAPARVLEPTINPSAIAPHTVLVASTMPLDWIPLIQQAAALVTEQGGLTSHSAIVARELGVPAVMGVTASTQAIRSGELLWVDGDRGRVYRLPNSAVSSAPPATPAEAQPSLTSILTAPAVAVPETKLLVNASQPSQVQHVAQLPVAGVGLLRAELLAMTVLQGQQPEQWVKQHAAVEFVERMATAIAEFTAAFQPRPVFYRSLDLRVHEFAHTESASFRRQSMLGLRGTLSYQVDPTLFKLELQALRRVQHMGFSNLRLLLPFVRTVEEFQFCQQLVHQAGLSDPNGFQLWIMAEVPSILFLLPEYKAAGVQGISIGSNDLTQLLLGVDRDDACLADQFEARHPAVQRAIAQLIQQARSLKIPCSICGEAPVRYPELILDLIRWGIDAISVAPDAVEATQQAIFQAERSLSPTPDGF